MFLRSLLAPSTTFICQNKYYSVAKPLIELYGKAHTNVLIKVESTLKLVIRPELEDGQLIRASLLPIDPVDDIRVESYVLDIKPKDSFEGKVIKAGLSDGVSAGADNVLCVLDVPVNSSLLVLAKQTVDVQNINGRVVNITSIGDIRTRNLQQTDILKLESKGGCIECDGHTMSEKINLRVYGFNVSAAKHPTYFSLFYYRWFI